MITKSFPIEWVIATLARQRVNGVDDANIDEIYRFLLPTLKDEDRHLCRTMNRAKIAIIKQYPIFETTIKAGGPRHFGLLASRSFFCQEHIKNLKEKLGNKVSLARKESTLRAVSVSHALCASDSTDE